MKRLICLTLVAGIFSLNSLLAQTSELKSSDKQALFGSQKSTQIATLSKEEMQEVQGKFWLTSLIIFGITSGLTAIFDKEFGFETFSEVEF